VTGVDDFFTQLDGVDRVFDLLLAAVDGFVADDDAVDVAVRPRAAVRRSPLSVTLSIGPTVTLGPNSAASAAPVRRRRRGKADRASSSRSSVGADLLDPGCCDVWPLRTARRKRWAGCAEVGRRLLLLEKPPLGVTAVTNNRTGDGAHWELNRAAIEEANRP
jgi:hypothetical protein